MKHISRLVVGAFSLLFVSSLLAAEIKLTATGNYFAAGGGWEGGEAPKPGNAYVVPASKELRVAASAVGENAFKGDSLTLQGASGSLVFKQGGSTAITVEVGNLRVTGGRIVNNSGTAGAGTLAGTCEVSGDPAWVYGDNITPASGMKNITLGCALAGSAEAVIKCWSCLSGTPSKTPQDPLANHPEIHVTGDCAQYFGTFVTEALFPINTYGQLGVDLYLESATALSADSGVLQADKISISSPTKLFLSPAAAAGASANVGMTVSGTNWISSTSAEEIALAFPIAGSGTLVKRGAATMMLSGEISLAGGLVVEEGTLNVAKSATVATKIPLVVRSGAALVCGVDPSDFDLTVEPGGTVSFVVPYDAATRTATPLEFTDDTAAYIPSWPMGITLSDAIIIPFKDAIRTCVVKIPTSAKTVTAADFLDLTAKTYGLPRVSFEVETVGTMQNVYFCARPVITDATSGNIPSFDAVNDAKGNPAWFDGFAPHDDADYLVLNKHELFTCEARTSGATSFAGASLTLADGQTVNPRSQYVEIADFVVYGFTTLYNLGYQLSVDNRLYHVLRGSVNVQTMEESKAFTFHVAPKKDQTPPTSWKVESELTGEGYVCFRSEDADPTSDAYLESTNVNFRGPLMVKGKDASCGTTLKIRNPLALGGPRDAFYSGALQLTQKSFLMPLESMTLDTANRGIYVNGTGGFDVPEGVVFKVTEPMVLYTPLIKKGAGVLGLGFEMTRTPAVNVAEGFVMPMAGRTMANASLTLADGAGLAVDVAAEGDVRAEGLYLPSKGALSATGNVIPIRIENIDRIVESDADCTIAIATVHEDDADALAAKMVLPRVRKHGGRIEVGAAADGVKVISATFEPKGIVLVVR